ncbi:MAG: hypothetical protein PVG30_02360 [Gammaproteobacteria bacterium]|jgi:hypothetical protein
MSNIRKIWILKEKIRLKNMIRLFDYMLSQYHVMYGDETRLGVLEAYKNNLINREYAIRELKELEVV